MPDKFIADLHIHSRFSRATSGRLTPAHLAAWAGVKGIKVVGTGDFTHPEWRAELAEKFEPDQDSGLYRLKKGANLAAELPEPLGPAVENGAGEPLFLLQAEISSIYKRHGRVRKVHNLVFMPDFEAAERFCRQLAAVGNLNADGRPILGLDSALLLEMVLNCHPGAALVPAHIWTPWFSIFGSKSGFDSLEECFGDLAGEIFAVETGLSSDPPMIRLWSHLDRISLISNSDAHSGENLGREGNVFSGPPSYEGIFNALRGRASACAHLGSLEFFPEEGKYHLDGHRACGVVMEPGESRAHGNVCPVCGKGLTIGVLNRVMELADRPAPPDDGQWPGFSSLIPLPEIIGELLDVGSKSKAVAMRYAEVVARFGPELDILRQADEGELRRHWEGLGEAVARMRRGEVIRQGGYDGEYGVVRVFSAKERRELKTAGRAMQSLAGLPRISAAEGKQGAASGKRGRSAAKSLLTPPETDESDPARPSEIILAPEIILTPEQEEALAGDGPTLIVAGPGAGKTRTLVEGVRRLLEHGENPDKILALTFTRRAAGEMAARLEKTLGKGRGLPHCLTLHALAWRNLLEKSKAPVGAHGMSTAAAGMPGMNASGVNSPPLLPPDASLLALFSGLPEARDLGPAEAKAAFTADTLARESLVPPPAQLQELCAAYARLKKERNLADHTDILESCLRSGPNKSFTHVFVDEIQDLTPLQLALVRRIAPDSGRGFFGIGDPNQSIYSFRGVRPDVAARLREFWPDLAVKSLPVSHRSAAGILDAASSLLPGQNLRAARALPSSLRLFGAPDEEIEARWVAAHVGLLLGGSSLSRANEAPAKTFFGITPDGGHLEPGSCSPGDLAVLVRLKAQIPAIARAMREAGLPFAVPEEEGFWHDSRVAEIMREAARRFMPGADAGKKDVPGPVADKDGKPAPAPDNTGVSAAPRQWPALPLLAPPAKKALEPGKSSSPGNSSGGIAFAASPGDADGAGSLWDAIPQEIWNNGPEALARHCAGQAPLDELFAASAPFRALSALWRAEGGWRGLLNELSFRNDLDEVKARAERVQIMTLHACKGLEFRAVFICGLEDGLLPLDFARLLPLNAPDATHEPASGRNNMGDGHGNDAAGGPQSSARNLRAGDPAEERRLLNVGLTRAAEAAFLSRAARRKIWGITCGPAPSPFLEPLEDHCKKSILKSKMKSVGKKLSLL